VYASIEADLIYASENLAASHKGKSNKRAAWHFREGVFISRQLCKGGNYFRKCNHGRLFM
jgi:hypothetical protein